MCLWSSPWALGVHRELMATPCSAAHAVLSKTIHMKFVIKHNGMPLLSEDNIAAAIATAEALFNAKHKASTAEDHQVMVVDDAGKGLAFFTTRFITGTFHKEVWANANCTSTVDTVEFDATDYVLLMPADKIRGISDRHGSGDEIGIAHVPWNGPHTGKIEEAVVDFFGVARIQDITDELVEFARQQYKPRPVEVQTITYTVTVKVASTGPGIPLDVADLHRQLQVSYDTDLSLPVVIKSATFQPVQTAA